MHMVYSYINTHAHGLTISRKYTLVTMHTVYNLFTTTHAHSFTMLYAAY